MRIRWYDRIEDYRETVPVFVELKSREGFASSKQRRRLLVPAQYLEMARLGAGIIGKTTLIETIAGFGHFPEKHLQPIITISYRRRRFTEMSTGVRVSLDHNIRSTFVARHLGYGERDLPIRGGVIEVKGPSMELPATLRRIRLLDTDWSRFSKYSVCVDTHLLHPRTMSRLWPAGRNIET